MSKREWKPGDVAMVKVYGRELFCTFYDTGAERGWFHGLGCTGRHSVAQVREVDARPLVVIDPEDPKAVERLVVELRNVKFWSAIPINTEGIEYRSDQMQAALREYADPKPPKPEEPTGRYAEVEDRRGWLYFRDPGGVWRRAGNVRRPRRWDEIDVVKVLSEGVTP